MILEETTEVKTSPEDVYRFFEAMEANYLQWHPDHVTFRWVDGGSLEEGEKAYFEGSVPRRGAIITSSRSFVAMSIAAYS